MLTISKFTNASDAMYTKELLEENGIKCEIKGDQYSEGIERIELQLIKEKDMDLAQSIIANDERD